MTVGGVARHINRLVSRTGEGVARNTPRWGGDGDALPLEGRTGPHLEGGRNPSRRRQGGRPRGGVVARPQGGVGEGATPRSELPRAGMRLPHHAPRRGSGGLEAC